MTDYTKLLQRWHVCLDTGVIFYAQLLIQKTTPTGTEQVQLQGHAIDGSRIVTSRICQVDANTALVLTSLFRKEA